MILGAHVFNMNKKSESAPQSSVHFHCGLADDCGNREANTA